MDQISEQMVEAQNLTPKLADLSEKNPFKNVKDKDVEKVFVQDEHVEGKALN